MIHTIPMSLTDHEISTKMLKGHLAAKFMFNDSAQTSYFIHNILKRLSKLQKGFKETLKNARTHYGATFRVYSSIDDILITIIRLIP